MQQNRLFHETDYTFLSNRFISGVVISRNARDSHYIMVEYNTILSTMRLRELEIY